MNMETQALALSLLLSASVPLLPNGWSLARDSASGKFYYYNTSTGAVQWDPPPVAEGSAPQVDPAAVQSTANALMAAGAKRGADGTPALSAAGVLLGGAGGAGGGHHAEKRARLGEGRQSDFEEETVQKLTLWCGEATSWNTKKKVIEAFKTSPMWATWTKAGHNEQKLVNFIYRLKSKHLEQGHRKDNGAVTAEFETEVIEKLNQWCGEISAWNVKKKVLDSFKDSAAFWSKWQAAGHSEQKLVNLINRLKIRHTEEAAKNNAAAAAALAAANGTTPPGIISAIGAAGGVSAFESEVVSQLQTLCGEASTWNTKKKVVDAFKNSAMWDSWLTAGHNEQKLVNFINRLKIKHLEEGGGGATGGGGVSSFEPDVVRQLTHICGQNAANWNTKKNVMDALKASPLWATWTSTQHTEQQLVNFINRLKMKHLKDEPVQIPVPPPVVTLSGSMSNQNGLAAALYSMQQPFPPAAPPPDPPGAPPKPPMDQVDEIKAKELAKEEKAEAPLPVPM